MSINSENTALVLEGGGLRGVFTCGVLDAFMDNGVKFPFAIGVSAGACNGLSYMSGQRGRAKASNIDLMDKLEADGKIIVIRPVKPILVKRTETDTSKLRDLYNEGYRLATKLLK